MISAYLTSYSTPTSYSNIFKIAKNDSEGFQVGYAFSRCPGTVCYYMYLQRLKSSFTSPGIKKVKKKKLKITPQPPSKKTNNNNSNNDNNQNWNKHRKWSLKTSVHYHERWRDSMTCILGEGGKTAIDIRKYNFLLTVKWFHPNGFEEPTWPACQIIAA